MSLFQQLLVLSAGRPIFRASGHITLDGDDLVVSIHDDNDDAHVLTQSDPAKRCAAPAAHADFAGQLCLTFVAASQNHYISNRTAAGWTFPLDAAIGGEIGITATRTANITAYLASTRNTANGFGLTHDAAGGAQWFGIANGVSIFNQTPASGWPLNTATYVRSKYVEGASPEVEIYLRGTQAYSGDSAATPSAPLADVTLNLGRRPNNTAFFEGRLTELRCFPQLDAAGVSIYQQYQQQTYGLAA